MRMTQRPEGIDYGVVFFDIARIERRHRTGCDPDLLRTRVFDKRPDLRRNPRLVRLSVVFQVPGVDHPLGGRPQGEVAPAIDLALRQDPVRPAEHPPEEPDEPPVARFGAVQGASCSSIVRAYTIGSAGSTRWNACRTVVRRPGFSAAVRIRKLARFTLSPWGCVIGM